MANMTGSESGRISTRDEIEAALRMPKYNFDEVVMRQSRSELEIAAEGLSADKVSSVLINAGLDSSRGLAGVPSSRERFVRSLLLVSAR